jgi:hypothetical protein
MPPFKACHFELAASDPGAPKNDPRRKIGQKNSSLFRILTVTHEIRQILLC